jgi:hypothetical protein
MDQKSIDLINEITRCGFVYRKFLSAEEIKICNSLVKLGYLYKSKPSERGATIAFYVSGIINI